MQVLLTHCHCSEAKVQRDVFVVNVDQVLDGLVDSVENTFDNVNSHLAGVGNWHRVSVDHLVTLLEDGALAASSRDLFLALVTHEVLLEDGIHNEARSVQKTNTEKHSVQL